ncbi:FAD-dependent oxidoreductase [Opitutaceae bacterium TAV4]|nr:FAD-dependent oxidoreductase [Opitutaceae bacterium TAV4]RRJ99494.1 FAD-dependent oxidoreductase [Opitutaceae bacterium TAV3]
MKTHTLFKRELVLDDIWDVIVAGGGPAGCMAAAAAAREGARTLLIESTGALGGMGTSALVPAWCPFSDKEKMIYRGLGEKVFTTLKAGMPHVPKDKLDWVPIDAEQLKGIYDALVTGFGASVLFHTQLASVERQGNRVNLIIVANKSGLTAYRAKVFIDCTGDADLSAWAGVPFQKGKAQGAKLMPATHCFVLSNVNETALKPVPGLGLSGRFKDSPIYRILDCGRYPLIPDAHLNVSKIGPGTLAFNAGHIWEVDNTDPWNVSRSMIQGRKMARSYRDALAEFLPEAFGDAFLVNTAPLMGIRETRRIVGDYVLALQDYIFRRSFPDEICRNAYYIDVHTAKEGLARAYEAYAESCRHGLDYGPGESHGVPYRSLIPKGVDNLLVAGRSISCEQIVQGSIRVMPVCLAMGEAAGMAGAMAALKHQSRVRDVDTDELRSRLREEGAYLPEEEILDDRQELLAAGKG